MTDTPPWTGFGHPGQAPPGYPGYGQAGQQAPWSPGAWNTAAAPAPGSIPLRPLGVGDILSGSFTLIRQNPGATLGLTASAVSALAVALVIIFVIAVNTAGALMFFAVPAAVALFGLQLGGLAAAMGRGVLGCKLTIAEALRHARAGWVMLATVVLALMFIALWLPLIGLAKGWGVIPALGLSAWLAVMVSLTIPVVVLERRGPLAAIGRSWRLVSGSYWRVFGIYLLMYLMASTISFVINLPLGLASGLADGLGSGSKVTVSLAVVVYAIGEIVIASLTATIELGVIVLVYADMRMRKEGMDLVLQQAAQNHQLTGDEFATSRLTSAYTGGADPGAGYPGGAAAGGGYPGGYPGGGYPGGAAAGGYPAGPPGI